MSVLVKGMEMPGSCYQCNMCVNVLYGEDIVVICTALEKEIIALMAERQDDCPLVEVPTPHGRLIDADALTTYPKPIGKLMMYGGEYVYTQTAIDDAPTIIGAEVA